jgi:NADP-dependent aldehyde dehydrogenase
LVADPRIKAVGFTGSLSGGQALMDIVAARDEPIPFYGELSSLNPLVITAGAAEARTSEIADGLFTSFTASAGQLCTKPGVAFIPKGNAGDSLVAELGVRVDGADSHPLLNSRIFESFTDIEGRLIANGHATVVASGEGENGNGTDTDAATAQAGFAVAPRLLTIDAAEMTPDVTEEAFGPLLVVARYTDVASLTDGLGQVPNSLTATIHSEPGEEALVAQLTREVSPHVGRLVFNGYPTGVRVSWAQHHGGPWPATNSQHTSVGVSAVRRFLRPFVWQGAPDSSLPPELRDGYTGVPRRIDGVLTLAESAPES